MNRNLDNAWFKEKTIFIFIVMISLILSSMIYAPVSKSKYVLDTNYVINIFSASSFGNGTIPLTDVPPTYTSESLPPASDPVPVVPGSTIAVIDPDTGATYYVVVRDGTSIWINPDGTLGATKNNTFLQINDAKLDWYSEPSSPNYSSWNNFYNNNTWIKGDVLIWHFGSPEQTRTFVWNFKNKKNNQPPSGSWVEIT